MKHSPVQTEALLRHLRTSIASALPAPVGFSAMNEALAMALFGRPWSPTIAAARAGVSLPESVRPGATNRLIDATLPWVGTTQRDRWPAQVSGLLQSAIAASSAVAPVTGRMSSAQMEQALFGALAATSEWPARLRPLFDKMAAVGRPVLHLDFNQASVRIQAQVGAGKILAVTGTAVEGDTLLDILAGRLECDRSRLSQESPFSGCFRTNIGDRLCLTRVNTVPNHGGGMHMGIVFSMNATGELESLGFTKPQASALRTALSRPSGLVLFAGMAGSGKSSSCAAALRTAAYAHNRSPRSTAAVVEPWDVPEDAARTRVATPMGDDQSFRRALSSLMHSDPDIVLVGEIRTPESARQALNVVRSGHLVISTLHAPSAWLVPARLHDLGLDWKDIGSPDILGTCIHQNLLPVLCPWCSLLHPHAVNECASVAALVAEGRLDASRLRHPSPHGCQACSGTGYSGRTACAEVFVPGAEDRAHIIHGDIEGLWRRNHEKMTGRASRIMDLLSDGRVFATDIEWLLGHGWPTDT